MDIEFFRNYCLTKHLVTEETPFNEDTLVFKVNGKMFCLFSIQKFESINLKCDPEKAIEYRSEYYSIEPGYHMNKKHWNTVRFNGDVSDELILQLVDD